MTQPVGDEPDTCGDPQLERQSEQFDPWTVCRCSHSAWVHDDQHGRCSSRACGCRRMRT